MKTNRKKTSGFFIVEILIVLLIVGILAVALLPNLTTYVDRARFSDNVNAAVAMKTGVEFCVAQLATTVLTGSNCIPAQVDYPATSNVASVAVVAATGVITATSSAALGGFTYTLTPTYNAASRSVTWVAGGTCGAQNLC